MPTKQEGECMKHSLTHDAINYLLNYPRYIYGLSRLARIKQPIVTIFGGKRANKESDYYQQAYQLAENLVKNNISILTGGGSGIMESALCGAVAQRKKDRALGIGVHGIDVEFVSACGHETIFLGDFALRKWLLIRYSIGFICFPGGIGTLDEIVEVLNLIKTEKLSNVPMVLIGKNYWRFIIEWIKHAVTKNFIAPEYADLFLVTDDIQKALAMMIEAKKLK